MSIASRCYAGYDQPLADRFREAAVKAWTWATAHPDVIYHNPKGILTGDYGDNQVADELLWASAELWRTTGDARYEQAFLKGLPSTLDDLKVDAPSWGGVRSMAYWAYALAPRNGDARVKSAISAQTESAAQALVARGGQNGYGNTLAQHDYIWGSNSVAANQSLLLAIAHHLHPNQDFVTAALNNLHYLLGRNCHAVSWVTQVGTRPFLHPHHRPSAADGIAAPWPGLLSGGPNHGRGDAVAAKLPDLPPMRMWVDNQEAYSLNEIAINWNAPLVFLLAFANTGSTSPNRA
jgi:endoglucanase